MNTHMRRTLKEAKKRRIPVRRIEQGRKHARVFIDIGDGQERYVSMSLTPKNSDHATQAAIKDMKALAAI